MLNLRTIITLLIPSGLLGFSFLWWKRKQNKSVKDQSTDECNNAEIELQDSAIIKVGLPNKNTTNHQNVQEIMASKLMETNDEKSNIDVKDAEKSFTMKKVEEEIVLVKNEDQTECFNCYAEMYIDDLNQSLPPSPTKSNNDSTCTTRFRHLSSCDCDSAYVEDYSSDNVSVSSSDTASKSPGLCLTGHALDEHQKKDENLSLSLENCRNWYGPALESVIKEEESFDWGSSPMSDTDCISEMFTGVSFEQVNTHTAHSKRKGKDSKKMNKKADKETKSKKKTAHDKKNEIKESSLSSSPSKPNSTPKNSKTSPRKRHEKKRKAETPRKGIENCWRDSCETEYDNTITTTLDYMIPDEFCGRLIGKNGKNVNEIKQKSGAVVCIEPEFRDHKRVVSITGTLHQIKKSEKLLNSRFDDILVQVQELDIDVAVANMRESSLSHNSTLDCIVTAIVDDDRFFVQIFSDEVDKNIVDLQKSLEECYLSPRKKYVYIDTLPQVGDICVGYIDFTWCRLKVVEMLSGSEVCVSFLDYGGMVNVPVEVLLKTRSDFLKLPIQAIECCLWRPNGENHGNAEMFGLLVEGKVLQARLKSRDDGVSSVDLSFVDIDTQQVVSINEALAKSTVYSAT